MRDDSPGRVCDATHFFEKGLLRGPALSHVCSKFETVWRESRSQLDTSDRNPQKVNVQTSREEGTGWGFPFKAQLQGADLYPGPSRLACM